MDLLIAGGIIGFLASFAATYAWTFLTRPYLTAGEVLHDDLVYDTIIEDGSERRLNVLEVTSVIDPETGTLRPTDPNVRQRQLRFFSVNIHNAPRSDRFRRRFARQVAMATVARLDFQQFLPGRPGALPNAKHFTFFGRWGSTPEPGSPPRQLEIRRGQRVDIPHDRMEGLNISLKYTGEDSAWGFTNESYYYVRRGRGLWRHPDFEIPLGTHFRVTVRLECVGAEATYYYHLMNTGQGADQLDLHAWHGCSDCSQLSTGSF